MKARDSQQSTQRLVDACAGLIERVHWDHFHTLTFRPVRLPSTLDDALQSMHHYARTLGGLVQDSVPYLAVAETGPATRTHLHAFTKGTTGVDPEALRARWRKQNGHSDVEEYDPQQPGARYASKMADGGAERFDMKTNNAADELLRKNA